MRSTADYPEAESKAAPAPTIVDSESAAEARTSSGTRLPVRLMGAGLGAASVAVLADVLWSGSPGFGGSQKLLLAGALLLVSAACVLASPAARRRYISGVSQGEVGGEMLQLLCIAAELGLLLMVIRLFRIESPAFRNQILPLTICGFFVHHALPARLKLPWFLFLSLAGIALAFGAANGAWLVAVGLVLIGVCHLPIAFGIRVAMLVGIGFLLALARGGVVPTPWSNVIWPILGSMFMFRMILYLYDLRHPDGRVNGWRTLAYFFLLPNVVFPLFPAVDFGTFRRTHYDRDAFWIYQRGVRWLLLGTGHLILYRLVYQNLTVAPSEVTSATGFAQHVLANFALYLRISGIFHLIVGLLHLFGFRLPETNHFFFLASSFTDFWRRINIYWKDFMQKVFQYPAYFRLRSFGSTPAIVVGTLLVFVATWALHSYQWYWILGSLLVSWPDVLFWTVLAGLLVLNVLYELKHGRKRSLVRSAPTARDQTIILLRTTATLTTIAILWSLWTSPTLADWFGLWAGAGSDVSAWVGGLALVAAGALVFVAALTVVSRAAEAARPLFAASFWPSSAVFSLALLALFLIGQPEGLSRVSVRAAELVRDLKNDELNAQDAALQQRGYYESLTGFNPLNSQLWEHFATAEAADAKYETVMRRRDDFLGLELRPMVSALHWGIPLATNRWGMRDKHYDQKPPPGTLRIAVLGQSYVMGYKVRDYEAFESLLEETLNANQPVGGVENPRRIEILNFATGDYSPDRQAFQMHEKVFDFQPDVVLHFAHPADADAVSGHLRESLRNRYDIPFDFLTDYATRAGVESNTSVVDGERRLRPYRQEMLFALYRWMVEECLEREIKPAWVYLAMPGEKPRDISKEDLARLAAGAGFAVLDLSDVYEGFDPESLQVDPRADKHPNPRAHRLIADRLYRELVANPDLLAFPAHRRGLPAAGEWARSSTGAVGHAPAGSVTAR